MGGAGGLSPLAAVHGVRVPASAGPAAAPSDHPAVRRSHTLLGAARGNGDRRGSAAGSVFFTPLAPRGGGPHEALHAGTRGSRAVAGAFLSRRELTDG